MPGAANFYQSEQKAWELPLRVCQLDLVLCGACGRDLNAKMPQVLWNWDPTCAEEVSMVHRMSLL